MDGSGLIAIPGLYNMHTHGHDMFWRGTREGAGVDRRWPDWFWNAYDTVSTETCTAAATAAYVNSLRCGVTFVADHLRRTLDGPPFVEVLGALGLPGAVFASRPYGESSPLTLPHETAPRFEEALEQAARLPRRPVMIHAQETPHRLEQIQRRTGRSTVELLDDHGLLHERTFLVHLCAHSDSDLELAAARGACVVATPTAEMKLGERTLDPERAARFGLKLLLGTDGPAYQNSNDLFTDLKQMALLWAREHGPGAVRVEELLAAVTWRAAEALGRRGGRLRAGEPADLTLLAAGTLSLEPLVSEPFENIAVQLVYCATGADIQHVVAAGRLLVEDGRCLAADEPAVLAALREAVGRHFRLHF
ncbi:MAG TPA: amidohydrolase family protein [Thermoanaerobaculia bacterium]|nr:amidohydrolase family protein [Thermoanaerobaculia bacterium]